MGKQWKQWWTLLSWASKSLWTVAAVMKLKMLAPWKKSYDKAKQHVKQRHYFTSKGLYSQNYGFSSSHVWMWELDHKEDWALKNWCSWTVVLEKTLESPLDCKETKPVNPKGNQSWIFIGMLKLKLQFFGHLMRRTDSLEKALIQRKFKAGGKGEDRRGNCWVASLTWWTWVWASYGSFWWTGKPGMLHQMI